MEIVEIIDKEREQEVKDQFTYSAFTGWQITEFLKGSLIKNPKHISFDQYLSALNLNENENEEKKITNRKVMKERALRKANRILENYKQQQRGEQQNGGS